MGIGAADAQAGTGGIDGDTQNLVQFETPDTGDDARSPISRPASWASSSAPATFRTTTPGLVIVQRRASTPRHPGGHRRAGVNWTGAMGAADLTVAATGIWGASIGPGDDLSRLTPACWPALAFRSAATSSRIPTSMRPRRRRRPQVPSARRTCRWATCSTIPTTATAPTWSRSADVGLARGHAQGRRRLQPRLHLRQQWRQSGRRHPGGRHGPAGLLSSQEHSLEVVRVGCRAAGSAALFRWREFAHRVRRKASGSHRLFESAWCCALYETTMPAVRRNEQCQQLEPERSNRNRGWRGPGGQRAQAASEVDVGGFHDRAIATTQQDLMGDVPAAGSPQATGPVQMRMDVGPTSALTGFTPRLGGLAVAAAAIPQRICSSTRPTKNHSGYSSASATRPASLAGKSAWRRPRTWGGAGRRHERRYVGAVVEVVNLAVSACASTLRSGATPRCSASTATE